jgi:Ti-type conjugative transfer relaxase TraA
MIAVGGRGKGLSGCLRYVMGEGNDRDTHERRPDAANDNESRVAWISGQGWREDWKPENRADVEHARKLMEQMALNQRSKTRQCEKDCLHLVLSWRTGETPNREEMETAAREAMAAVGMEKARAVFVAHRDTDHDHLHIVASRINPETGRAFSDSYTNTKWQKWCLEWERSHGLVQCLEREKRSQLHDAISELNAAAVVDLMTQRQATFTGKELDRELAKVLSEKDKAAEFKAEILAQADIVPLHDRDTGNRLDRFTTQGVRESEKKALDHAAVLAANDRHSVSEEAKAAALAKCSTMREEQRKAFEHATAAEGLAIIDGKAGTGKSYTMSAIRDAYEGDGKRVIGLAPTNAVVQDMQRDGFTEARTVHSALFALKNDRDRWNENTVVMVDEAAMIGGKIMAELLARADAAGAKLVLVGDDRQLSSIERGGMFTELRERHGAAELADVTRQRDADHKAAAEMLSRGEFAEGVAALDKLGCITRENHQTESRAALVAQWTKDTAAETDKSRFVFAYTNADVQQLNAELRAVRKERGELGDDHELKTKDGKAMFAEGDRLTFTTTDKKQGIINGAMGTIERIEEQFITLKMDGKSGRLFTFNADKVDGFRHAYAGTIYKGQGRTFDDVYLYHSQHWKDSSAYVALTRHRDDVKLFVSTEVTRDTADLARQLARHDDRRASVAFATHQEAEQQRNQREHAAAQSERLQAAAQEVTGKHAEPVHQPPPKSPEPEPEKAKTHPAPERPAPTVAPVAKHSGKAHGEDDGKALAIVAPAATPAPCRIEAAPVAAPVADPAPVAPERQPEKVAAPVSERQPEVVKTPIGATTTPEKPANPFLNPLVAKWQREAAQKAAAKPAAPAAARQAAPPAVAPARAATTAARGSDVSVRRGAFRIGGGILAALSGALDFFAGASPTKQLTPEEVANAARAAAADKKAEATSKQTEAERLRRYRDMADDLMIEDNRYFERRRGGRERERY